MGFFTWHQRQTEPLTRRCGGRGPRASGPVYWFTGGLRLNAFDTRLSLNAGDRGLGNIHAARFILMPLWERW